MGFADKIFGTHSDRELKRIMPLVNKVEALRPAMQALSDAELKAKTDEYRKTVIRMGRRLISFCRRHSQLSGKQPKE